jgi:hypothetical protein
MVRVKFKVTEIHRTMGAKYIETEKGRDLVPSEVRTIRMQPVAGKHAENEKFWGGTPRGQIEITCINAEAGEQFDLDREFFVEFSPAE